MERVVMVDKEARLAEHALGSGAAICVPLSWNVDLSPWILGS